MYLHHRNQQDDLGGGATFGVTPSSCQSVPFILIFPPQQATAHLTRLSLSPIEGVQQPIMLMEDGLSLKWKGNFLGAVFIIRHRGLSFFINCLIQVFFFFFFFFLNQPTDRLQCWHRKGQTQKKSAGPGICFFRNTWRGWMVESWISPIVPHEDVVQLLEYAKIASSLASRVGEG